MFKIFAALDPGVGILYSGGSDGSRMINIGRVKNIIKEILLN